MPVQINPTMRKLIIVIFCCLSAFFTSANDGVFYAAGNQLIPITETDISVQKEVLTLNRVGDHIEVTVYYEFFNPVGEKELLVGFEAQSPYNSMADAFKMLPKHPHIRNFKVVMNGEPLTYDIANVKSGRYDKHDNYILPPYYANGRFLHWSPQQIEEAFALAREEGFDNINMDVIMGLPGEDLEDVEDTLQKIGRMRPDSLTVHSLSIKRTSQIFSQTTDAQTVEQMLEKAAAFARNVGMEPYYLYRQKGIAGNFENTGWAVPGKECLYNILIMEEIQSILAVGAGASTKRLQQTDVLQIKRSHNVSNIKEYLTRIDEMIERKMILFS